MIVVFHEDFYPVYTTDPAAATGRMEAIVDAIGDGATFRSARQAEAALIAAVHTPAHIEAVRRRGLYDIAALAAGAAVQAAEIGLTQPAFGLVRPPGHHASSDSCWGFCYFNNMAVALRALKDAGRIGSAFLLDFDLHYGDGNVNTLGGRDWVTILNPEAAGRGAYRDQVRRALEATRADMIAVSAGFDHHRDDWGGLLETDDYRDFGRWVQEAAARNGGGCFGLLEGGYNHGVLGANVKAFLEGLDGPEPEGGLP